MKGLKLTEVRIPRNIWLLLLIWGGGVICDRVWFSLDNNVPGWDQADYLTGTLNYQRALQTPQWSNGDWWRDLWLLSSKIPPLTYITTGLLQNLVGVGIDQATIVMSFYSAVLLGSVYGLGCLLFHPHIGLLAAGLCQIIPGLYRLRLEFLLDYPLAAMVMLSFFCLTAWHLYTQQKINPTLQQKININQNPYGYFFKSLVLAICFGVTWGLALLTKQTSLFFLIVPIVWISIRIFFQRHWGKFLQLLASLWISTCIFMPWYRTNWLTVITSGKRATIDSAIAEGDAPLNTLAAWTFYWEQLPQQLSFPLLLIPIVGLIIYIVNRKYGRGNLSINNLSINKFSRFTPFPEQQQNQPHQTQNYQSLRWLLFFLISAYLLSSLNVNKDDRYIIPYLPVLTIVLAYGLTCLQTNWWRNLRLATLILATCLTFLNLFPLPGYSVLAIFTPQAQHHPYQGLEFPHSAVIQEITRTQPYLRSTVGVLPSTYSLNQHNINYYGAIANFQVYGRQVATNRKYLQQDINALDWFISKTGNQGSIGDIHKQATNMVETSPEFQLQKSWKLPDGETLKLYHKVQPPTTIQLIKTPSLPIKLTQIITPNTSPAGVPIPITYIWEGNIKTLKDGVILLTWQNTDNPNNEANNAKWLHDHSIGMGNIYRNSPNTQFNADLNLQIRDRTAMLPPANIPPGKYRLQAIYCDRHTKATYPISVPDTTIEINPQATPTPAPDLDLSSQFRNLAATMPNGIKAFEQIFAEIGRINQYDPTQDYLQQVLIASAYRLENDPQNRDLAYTVALTNVLLRHVEDAIASLEYVTQIDPHNPFAWGYLAFVHLYNWHPQAAEIALQPALQMNPQIPEIKALAGISALLQGKVIAAYRDLSSLKL